MFKKYFISCFIGILYYLLIIFTDISLSCPFRYLTGYLCPGCGVTTMFLALLNGDFAAARQANVFLFYTLPFLLASIILRDVYGKALARSLDRYVYPLYVIALLVFGIARNGLLVVNAFSL